MTDIMGLKIPLSPHLIAPALFIVTVLILNLIRVFVFARLKKLTQKSKNRWDDAVVSSLRFPALLCAIAAGVWAAEQVLPPGSRIHKWLDHSFLVLAVWAAAYFVNRITAYSVDSYADKHDFLRNSQGLLHTFIKIVVYSMAAMIYFDSIGVSITPLLASLGIGSVAVALALQDTLNNLFSGFYLLLDRPIRAGDFIKLESGEQGYVEKVGWRSTRIRLLPNNIVIIPNAKISGSTLLNYYLPEKEMAVLVQVGVSYDSDLEKVEKVTIEVAKEIQKTVEGAVPDFEPFIRYHTFDNSSINFTVILRAKEFVANYLMKHEFIKALHKRYNKEGIVIPFPITTLHVPDDFKWKVSLDRDNASAGR